MKRDNIRAIIQEHAQKAQDETIRAKTEAIQKKVEQNEREGAELTKALDWLGIPPDEPLKENRYNIDALFYVRLGGVETWERVNAAGDEAKKTVIPDIWGPNEKHYGVPSFTLKIGYYVPVGYAPFIVDRPLFDVTSITVGGPKGEVNTPAAALELLGRKYQVLNDGMTRRFDELKEQQMRLSPAPAGISTRPFETLFISGNYPELLKPQLDDAMSKGFVLFGNNPDPNGYVFNFVLIRDNRPAEYRVLVEDYDDFEANADLLGEKGFRLFSSGPVWSEVDKRFLFSGTFIRGNVWNV